jgi:AcrR family transcriptional regulator
MGTKERKEREKLQRRIDIIKAAEKVFFSQGFENSTMEDIANAAELSKGTLYLYFESKEELYLAIMQKSIEILHDLFSKAVQNKKNGLMKVKAIGEAFMQFYIQYPDYNEAMLYGHSRLHQQNISATNNCGEHKLPRKKNKIFIEAIEEGIQDGSMRKNLDPVKTALLLWGESLGIMQLVTTQKETLEKIANVKPEELIRYFFDFTRIALKA